MENASCSVDPSSSAAQAAPTATGPPQLALLDYFFPGFSMLSGTVEKYTRIDLNHYIPWLLLFGGIVFFFQYFSEYLWGLLESHFLSTVDVRTDDEAYNMLMGWVAAQRFSQGARRFIVNTNLNSRSWFLWRSSDDEDGDDEGDDASSGRVGGPKKKGFSYTPTFGSHYFWYKGRLLIFRRNQNRDQNSYMVVSEREEISIACFGRDPWVLKELLLEARQQYMKRDERKTLIYRGTTRAGSTEPQWQRCLARNSRPLSTVILNEKVKQDLIQDVVDYLNPNTRRWYANRGIPYKRGYLLYGPAGCGKSSMALALAGHFEKMRIYIISLNSVTASEENLASLFAELPRRCVVLLEDIDTAGLTHTRDDLKLAAGPSDDVVPGQVTRGVPVPANQPSGRLSLSGLLNILDGVASQEGRILIMTTNHLEKLDKALIRPGRVDMIIKFDLADKGMISSIFKAIFAPLEGDEAPRVPEVAKAIPDPEAQRLRAEKEAAKRDEAVARVNVLADEFAEKVPAHEFSPAELQGYLMKKKADPAAAVAGAEEWVAETRKDRKEKELKEAEEKRKAEEEAEKKKKEDEEEAAKKKKEEDEGKAKEEKKQRRDKKKKQRDAKKKRKERRAKSEPETDSSSSSDSESDSASEAETAPARKRERVADAPEATAVEKAAEKVAEKAAVVGETVKKGDEAEGTLKAEEGKTGADSGYGTP